MGPGTRRASERLLFLDASRAVAMLCVFASHFGEVYFHSARHAALPELVRTIGMLASPTFVIISGLMLGALYSLRRNRLAELQDTLTDRGLFLITIGHLVTLPAFWIYQASVSWLFITDTIGLCAIAGAYLIDKLTARERVLFGAAAFTLSWSVVDVWHPTSTWARFAEEGIFGADTLSAFAYAFPIIPWFGIYIASSALGEWVGNCYRDGEGQRPWRLLRAAALVSLSLAVSLTLAGWTVGALTGNPASTGVASMLLSFDQKFPPSPVYVLWFGGCGLALLSLFALIEQRQWVSVALHTVALAGRNSFFSFTIQFYVYYVGLDMLGLSISPLWPLYFLASAALVFALATACNRRGYVRFLTVGFRGYQSRERLSRENSSITPAGLPRPHGSAWAVGHRST
jgi:uncharacterized membrane protein